MTTTPAQNSYWRRKVQSIRDLGLLDDHELEQTTVRVPTPRPPRARRRRPAPPRQPELNARAGTIDDPDAVARFIVSQHPEDFPGGIAELGGAWTGTLVAVTLCVLAAAAIVDHLEITTAIVGGLIGSAMAITLLYGWHEDVIAARRKRRRRWHRSPAGRARRR